MEHVPGIITAAVDAGHWQLPSLHTPMVRLGVTRSQDLNILSTVDVGASTPLALHDSSTHDMSMQLELNGTVYQMINLARPHLSSVPHYLFLRRPRLMGRSVIQRCKTAGGTS